MSSKTGEMTRAVCLLFVALTVLNACASSVADRRRGASLSAVRGGGGGGGAAITVARCSSALFCDDFESYGIDSVPGKPWSNTMNGGTLAIDATHAHSGTRSVKINAAKANGYRSVLLSLQPDAFLPTLGNAIYGRMMFWLSSAPATSVHWTFVAAEGMVPGQSYHAVYRYGGHLPLKDGADFVGSQLMASYETPDSYATPAVGVSSDCWVHSDKRIVPVATWSCAEWRFDSTSNQLQFWLNGEEITSLAVTGTGQSCMHQPASFPWSAPRFERIDLGWESYTADDARTIWIDDVAIGAQRVGCPESVRADTNK